MGNEINEAERCYLFSTLINYLIAPYRADAGVLAYGRLAYRQKSKKNFLEREIQVNHLCDARAVSTFSSATGQCSSHIN
jgi:hypothetical protein